MHSKIRNLHPDLRSYHNQTGSINFENNQRKYNRFFSEKGSKFIGFLYPVSDAGAFEIKLNTIRSEYPDATHHCYAYRIDPANLQKEIDRLKSLFNLAELDAEYLEEVELVIACPLEYSGRFLKELEQLNYLDIHYQTLGEGFIKKQ